MSSSSLLRNDSHHSIGSAEDLACHSAGGVVSCTYALDHQDQFPGTGGAQTSEAPLSLLVPKYTVRTDLFICPGSKERKLPSAEPFKDRRISYAYLMGAHGKMPSEQWLLSGNPWEFERRDVVFDIQYGGHLDRIEENGNGIRTLWIPDETIQAIAYDTPIVGWRGRHVNVPSAGICEDRSITWRGSMAEPGGDQEAIAPL